MFLVLATLVATAACQTADAPSQDGEPDAPLEDAAGDVAASLGFVPDAPPSGAALWLDVQGEAPDTVEVWSAGLGPVFGLSFHIRYDAQHVAVEAAQMASPLDSELPGEALYLARVAEGDVAFGGTRKGTGAGEATVDQPLRLATFRLSPRDGGTSRLDLTHVVVRRADGGFVSVETAGGTLQTGGAP